MAKIEFDDEIEQKRKAELESLKQIQRITKLSKKTELAVEVKSPAQSVEAQEGEEQEPADGVQPKENQDQEKEPGTEPETADEQNRGDNQDDDQENQKKNEDEPGEEEEEEPGDEKEKNDEEEPDEEDEDKDKDENEKEGEEEPNEDDSAQNLDALKNMQRAARAQEAAGAAGGTAAGGAAAGAGTAAAAEGAAAAGATATAPIWGTVLIILAIVALIIGLVVIIFAVIIAGCSESRTARVGSKIASWVGIIPEDLCNKIAQGGRSGGAGGGAEFEELNIVVTGAYRPGAVTTTGNPSAHGRAEAIDIALRNPSVPLYGSDPRIAQVISLAQAAGFTPAVGDTLNEYADPQCDPSSPSCGGHIHIEFNTYLREGTTYTYCDDTAVKTTPDNLVPIPSQIPVQGASNPSIRSCMLGPLQSIFQAAGVIP